MNPSFWFFCFIMKDICEQGDWIGVPGEVQSDKLYTFFVFKIIFDIGVFIL